jgi:cytochrome c5
VSALHNASDENLSTSASTNAARISPSSRTRVEGSSPSRATTAATATARFPGVEAVTRARSRLGEDRYRVWTNNCEHFVHWCLSGIPRSTQVERWGRRVRAALSALATPRRLAAQRPA